MLSQLELWRLVCCNPFRGRMTPEAALSAAVAADLRGWSLDGSLRAVWFKVPNEGKRSAAGAALLRAMGMIPGVYDFVFLSGRQSCCIELKVTAATQDNQLLFGRWCDMHGVANRVCRSREEVRAALVEAGLLHV